MTSPTALNNHNKNNNMKATMNKLQASSVNYKRCKINHLSKGEKNQAERNIQENISVN